MQGAVKRILFDERQDVSTERGGCFEIAELAVRGGHLAIGIVGDGECRGELEALARALEVADRVDFLGHSNMIPAHLANFDIFALSSDTEQMPIVVLEAMAACLPIASTDVGDVRVMVDSANATFVTRNGVEGLAGSLTRLVQDPALREKLGAANRAKAERDFDQATMFAAWRRLLLEGY